ncbi:MAG: hypothetical protein ACRENP_05625 [Longimicrobiales bacterium]
MTYDANRTSLSGFSASLRADKNAGRFTLWGIQLSTRSPGFDINDAGQMRSGDDIDFNADIQLRDTKPNELVRYVQFGTSTFAGWSYGGPTPILARFRERPGAASQFLEDNGACHPAPSRAER